MQRRKFSREYKLEAVKLVRERGVNVAQAARDLDVHKNVLRKWVKDYWPAAPAELVIAVSLLFHLGGRSVAVSNSPRRISSYSHERFTLSNT